MNVITSYLLSVIYYVPALDLQTDKQQQYYQLSVSTLGWMDSPGGQPLPRLSQAGYGNVAQADDNGEEGV